MQLVLADQLNLPGEKDDNFLVVGSSVKDKQCDEKLLFNEIPTQIRGDSSIDAYTSSTKFDTLRVMVLLAAIQNIKEAVDRENALLMDIGVANDMASQKLFLESVIERTNNGYFISSTDFIDQTE
ncbi:uncharacterized protein ASCRUDRAFT_10611 [Ascoidea rubescens DSM 1968]|uniref:Uncharacterized protein n=1 Tax=Ascoidea rubescens DSM 1968 TaxID=1344418 RepID=A0A1D2V8K0_9ASCO|nr:hypothetical protein ASCRUDRAFT_10611 [Ascoidea rubescens DSM 1968]ODV58006.1 hypothetical protein ASCRUDRAFT_10611 [Ascoidea rubescens DSM 1968]